MQDFEISVQIIEPTKATGKYTVQVTVEVEGFPLPGVATEIIHPDLDRETFSDRDKTESLNRIAREILEKVILPGRPDYGKAQFKVDAVRLGAKPREAAVIP